MKNEKDLIMLVDDNPANLRVGKNILTEHYIVATAPSAEKMFALLENNIPALILLDIDMPVMSGYEAIKVLKTKAETKKIPVIFLSGKTELNDQLEGIALGADDYITKPFEPDNLIERIRFHLSKRDCNETI